MIFIQYRTLYPKYFANDSKYLYGSVGKWLIVYEKAFFTKTNENTKKVCNSEFAEYEANKLLVKLIIEKRNPNKTQNLLRYVNFDEIITYTINQIIKFENNKIIFYKSYVVAYYNNLLENYGNELTEKYITWYENGGKSSEGNLVNGQMHGKWKFWYNTSDTLKINKLSFIAEYDNGVIVNKNECN